VVSQRQTREIKESLGLPLQRLEQAIDPAPDSPEAAELKRILLARVADLEVINPLDAEAPVSNARENSPVGPIVELAPVQIVVTEEPAQKAKDNAQPAFRQRGNEWFA